MGYTHYWHAASYKPEDFARASNLCAKACEASGVKIVYEWDDEESPPVFANTLIRFNGEGDDGHETFLFANRPGFAFCKTARKPYDLCVCACLVILNRVLGLSVSSDGDMEDWEAAIRLVERVAPDLDPRAFTL